jgi:two-component system response regulator CpxR
MHQPVPEKNILLVEDEAIIAMDEAETLSKYGFNVITAHDGESAVKAALNQSIDLILMDVDLGRGMDGPVDKIPRQSLDR